MAATPDPKDGRSAAYDHYGDYLGYAGDLGFEGRVGEAGAQPESDVTAAEQDADEGDDQTVTPRGRPRPPPTSGP